MTSEIKKAVYDGLREQRKDGEIAARLASKMLLTGAGYEEKRDKEFVESGFDLPRTFERRYLLLFKVTATVKNNGKINLRSRSAWALERAKADLAETQKKPDYGVVASPLLPPEKYRDSFSA